MKIELEKIKITVMSLVIILMIALSASADVYEIKLIGRNIKEENFTPLIIEMYPYAKRVSNETIYELVKGDTAVEIDKIINKGTVKEGDVYAFGHVVGSKLIISFLFIEKLNVENIKENKMIIDIIYPFDF